MDNVTLGGIRFDTACKVRLETADPWQLPPRPLDRLGRIAAHTVACVTADAQRRMHLGYQLAPHHQAGLRNLDLCEAWLRSTRPEAE